MKKLFTVLILIIVYSCQSVKKNNLFLEKKIPVEELKKDVDFTYQKLQRFHPNLYWYISKENLDHKFDSLKTAIQKPLTPNDFFFKLKNI